MAHVGFLEGWPSKLALYNYHTLMEMPTGRRRDTTTYSQTLLSAGSLVGNTDYQTVLRHTTPA